MTTPDLPTSMLEEPIGTNESMHSKVKAVFPDLWEGLKFVVKKPLTQHWQVGHSLTISNLDKSGYKFQTSYAGKNIVSPGEAYPLMMGEMSLNGDLNFTAINKWSNHIKTNVSGAFSEGKLQGYQISNDYTVQNKHFVGVTLANPCLFTFTGVGVAHYLTRIARGLDVGAEFTCAKDPQIPTGLAMQSSLVGRYVSKSGDWQLSGILNTSTLLSLMTQPTFSLYFMRKVFPTITFAASTEVSCLGMEPSAKATVGYTHSVSELTTVKAELDTDWNVGATWEKRIKDLPVCLSLSACINHIKNAYRFGIGFSLNDE